MLCFIINDIFDIKFLIYEDWKTQIKIEAENRRFYVDDYVNAYKYCFFLCVNISLQLFDAHRGVTIFAMPTDVLALPRIY